MTVPFDIRGVPPRNGSMKTDQLNRRVRYAPPNPVVRRLVLTDADYVIFEVIHRHGPLPTHYLYEFTKHLRRDYTHLQNRLTEFYNGDAQGPLLVRPSQQFASFNARYQHIVYDLAPRARALLAARGNMPRYICRRADPFVHQLMQACVGASLELIAPSKGLRYIPRWEILAHPRFPQATRDSFNPMALPIAGMGQKALIPDDLFGLEYPGFGFRFFAVEIDRNTESIERKNLGQSAFGTKITGYLDILRRQTYRAHWGVPNLHVMTVTTNGAHTRNILDHVRKHGDPAYADRFAITYEPSFGANWHVPTMMLSKLLDRPWKTTGGLKDVGRP